MMMRRRKKNHFCKREREREEEEKVWGLKCLLYTHIYHFLCLYVYFLHEVFVLYTYEYIFYLLSLSPCHILYDTKHIGLLPNTFFLSIFSFSHTLHYLFSIKMHLMQLQKLELWTMVL